MFFGYLIFNVDNPPELKVFAVKDGDIILEDTIRKQFSSAIRKILSLANLGCCLIFLCDGNLFLVDISTFVILRSRRIQECSDIGLFVKKADDSLSEEWFVMITIIKDQKSCKVIVLDLNFEIILQQFNPCDTLSIVKNSDPFNVNYTVIGLGSTPSGSNRELLCYSINSANNYRTLVQFIENGADFEAFEFAKKYKIPMDVCYKFKLSMSNAIDDIQVLIETLKNITVSFPQTYLRMINSL